MTEKIVIVPGEAGIWGLALVETQLPGPVLIETELQQITGRQQTLASHALPNDGGSDLEPSNINGLEGQTIR